jgi:hypothetical protein
MKKFAVIKTRDDGLGLDVFAPLSVEETVESITDRTGWDTLQECRDNFLRWAEKAQPGWLLQMAKAVITCEAPE